MTRYSQHTDQRTLSQSVQTGSLVLLATVALSGCYVEVVPQVTPHIIVTDSSTADLRSFSTAFLLDSALIPFALSNESPYMIIAPDSYTTPRARTLTRALIEQTTYAYLFDDWDCDAGGYTQTEAEAETTVYDDGYTFVDFSMNAQAKDCAVRQDGQLHWVNSNLDYNVTGMYDDWAGEIRSINGRLKGQVEIESADGLMRHRLVNVQLNNLTGTDFIMTGSSSVLIDDGYARTSADLTTRATVHWALGETFPHQGQVRLRNNSSWVDLTFESTGLWRDNSSGSSSFWLWSELGFQ